MEFGVHIPQILGEDDSHPDAAFVHEYSATVEALGYRFISANDHIVHRLPWVDGPTALAIAAAATKTVRLSTSVILPAIRNPFVAAKTLASLDHLSKGRLIVGVGAGSYEPDYALAGVPFDERAPSRSVHHRDALSLAQRGHTRRGRNLRDVIA